MAVVHRLANTGATSTYDFRNGTLKAKVGTLQRTPNGDGYITDSFMLVAKDSDANIMAAVQAISEFQEKCRLYWWNNIHDDPVWYEYSASAETAKRALVREIVLTPANVGPSYFNLGVYSAFYDIAITFQEEFEDRSATVIVNDQTITALGGVQTIGAQSGSWPARISLAKLTGVSGSGTLNEVWMGIRPTHQGVGSFVGLWELENGTLGTDASLVTDAAASPNLGSNNAVQVTFATATNEARQSIRVDQALSANYVHAVGKYNVLLRARLSAGSSEAWVQMRTGFSGQVNRAPYEAKKLTSTSYILVPLGQITIPSSGYYPSLQSASMVRNSTIWIYAERVSGAANLLLDCLVMIPAEHFTYSLGGAIAYGGIYACHYVHENGEVAAQRLDPTNNNPVGTLPAVFDDWECPIEGGLLVIAAQQASAQVITDQITVRLEAYHRHRIYND